jgi:hypothetical protein
MIPVHRVAVTGRTGKGNCGRGLDTAWQTHPGVETVAAGDEPQTVTLK